VADYFAHQTAVVDEGATIGSGTKVWHFSHVMGGARIGERCSIGQNVYVGNRGVVGNGVKVQNNVSIYDDVVIEDEAFLGPSCVFTNVINPRSFVERKNEYMKTHVGRGASIGANATILCGITLGEYCFVGAGAVVTKDVPAYGLVYGAPARPQGWVSRNGHRLGEDLVCPETGERYELSDGVLHPTTESE
jgi:UDP-2-acetamido-3-amino-2,3-dideoxy-glucuronate N-acetyltransferase